MKLRRAFFVVAAGASGLTLAAGADGRTATTAAQTRHAQGRIEALALDGSRIAYDAGSTTGKADNKVLVWDVRSGRTTRVSGKHTARADGTSTGAGVFDLAIAGSRVAWMVNLGGNTEGDDYLYASSVAKPKERQLASDIRYGDNCPGRSQALCAGQWLGGLVGSGNLIALNRWTTDNAGSVSDAELDVLNGTQLKQVATGTETVQAASTDGGRVAVLRLDGTVGLYSSTGNLLRTVSPPSAAGVAWSGHNLVVLTKTRTLELYYSPSGSPAKSFPVHGTQKPGNLDVRGNIAIYTLGPSVHAVNLGSGKDRVVGKLGRGDVALARIDSAGLAYAGNQTLVFVPFRRVAAAVAG
jgi:WD40 repeat protein